MEGVLILMVLSQVGHCRAHRLRAILDPLPEFAVGHDVQLVIEYALQHACADIFLGHVQMEEVARC